MYTIIVLDELCFSEVTETDSEAASGMVQVTGPGPLAVKHWQQV
jgi:hypothetical protein